MIRMCTSTIRAGLFFLLLGVCCLGWQSVAEAQTTSSNRLSPGEIKQLQAMAQAGNPAAQLDLAKAYDDGNSVPQSNKLAAKWYRAAAEQGDAAAQTNLGLMLRAGRGVEQDKTEALKWYHRAAKQKYPNAMFHLGTAYYNGDGTSIDDVTAYAWFLLAQSFGNQSADDAVKRMKEERRDLQPEAFEKIGDMYQKGDELPQESGEAVNWYRKAADEGAAPVQFKLASLLLEGKAGPPDYVEIRDLCEKAAKSRYSPATYCMGELYRRGLGVERNFSKAALWFTDAANLGHALSALRLGEMYWRGEGLKQDKIAAFAFIYMAAASDVPQAKQERERLEKELTPKELEKGKARAEEWSRRHHPVVLRGRSQIVN
jgi:uncharacterized protein